MKDSKLDKVFSVLGLVIGIGILFYIAKNLVNVEELINKAGVWGPAVALLLYTVFAPTPISTDPITIVSGALFGPFYGVLISWMGNNFAALVEYFIGTRITKSTDFEDAVKKLPLGLSKLPINSIPVLIFGRMLPFYGSKVISILAGMYGVSYKRYIWTSALVNLSGAIMLSYGGHYLLNFFRLIKF